VDNLLVKAMCVEACSAFVSDFCIKYMNNICDGINESDASVWHSRLCHMNFGSISLLSTLNLILNLSVVKSSKCPSCVQSKQP
jgi:hypothetical protein